MEVSKKLCFLLCLKERTTLATNNHFSSLLCVIVLENLRQICREIIKPNNVTRYIQVKLALSLYVCY